MDQLLLVLISIHAFTPHSSKFIQLISIGKEHLLEIIEIQALKYY